MHVDIHQREWETKLCELLGKCHIKFYTNRTLFFFAINFVTSFVLLCILYEILYHECSFTNFRIKYISNSICDLKIEVMNAKCGMIFKQSK